MISGSCCCGAIRFELSAEPAMMATCHCSRCRKLGASTFVFVETTTFHWRAGAEFVQTYLPEAPHTYARSFCGKCGTALGEVGSTAASFPIAANCLDGELNLRNRFHEFVAEKPGWYEICDDARQFPLHPSKP